MYEMFDILYFKEYLQKFIEYVFKILISLFTLQKEINQLFN